MYPKIIFINHNMNPKVIWCEIHQQTSKYRKWINLFHYLNIKILTMVVYDWSTDENHIPKVLLKCEILIKVR